MEKMTPQFKALQKQINRQVADSDLSEQDKYALLAGCITQVANSYHPCDFVGIRERLTLVCGTMLSAVDVAERVFSKFISHDTN